MGSRPKSNYAWASYVARMFKTIKPYGSGGHGLGGNRRFEAAFEGGWTDAPANADAVVDFLRGMVRSDLQLARAVWTHHTLDRTGIVGLAELATEVLERDAAKARGGEG